MASKAAETINLDPCHARERHGGFWTLAVSGTIVHLRRAGDFAWDKPLGAGPKYPIQPAPQQISLSLSATIFQSDSGLTQGIPHETGQKNDGLIQKVPISFSAPEPALCCSVESKFIVIRSRRRSRRPGE
jgi:hypothetical protein